MTVQMLRPEQESVRVPDAQPIEPPMKRSSLGRQMAVFLGILVCIGAIAGGVYYLWPSTPLTATGLSIALEGQGFTFSDKQTYGNYDQTVFLHPFGDMTVAAVISTEKGYESLKGFSMAITRPKDSRYKANSGIEYFRFVTDAILPQYANEIDRAVELSGDTRITVEGKWMQSGSVTTKQGWRIVYAEPIDRKIDDKKDLLCAFDVDRVSDKEPGKVH